MLHQSAETDKAFYRFNTGAFFLRMPLTKSARYFIVQREREERISNHDCDETSVLWYATGASTLDKRGAKLSKSLSIKKFVIPLFCQR